MGKYRATIEGVIPSGMSLPAAPFETREFANQSDATAWVLGDGLDALPTPVSKVEIFDGEGTSVFREWHWGHEALKAKNEKWWDTRDPGRHERAKKQAERKAQIASGAIPRSQMSDHEQFQADNPPWRGPFFASLPVKTLDQGWVWFSEYWERSHTGLRYARKAWFPHDE